MTRYGNSDERARVAAVMLMTLRGTPFIYYGEEIGMRDVNLPFYETRDSIGRDRCRTPMQWSSETNGSFTAGKPWLPLGDTSAVNVESQRTDPNSIWNLYRRLIALRKSTPALIDGRYRVFAPPPDDCLVYYRESSAQRLLIALNFAAEARHIMCPPGRMLLSTHPNRPKEIRAGGLRLTGNEAAIVELAP